MDVCCRLDLVKLLFRVCSPHVSDFGFVLRIYLLGSQKRFWRNGIEVSCYFDDAGKVFDQHRDFVLEPMIDSPLHMNVSIFGSDF